MAIRVAQLPTKNLITPMALPIYSGLAKKQHDADIFSHSVLQVVGATFAIAIPAAVLVSVLSEPIVQIVLGENWQQVVPILSAIVLALAAQAIAQPLGNVFTLVGRVKTLAVLQWFSTIVLITVLLVIVTQEVNLEQLAVARSAAQIGLLLIYFAVLCSVMALAWSRLLMSIIRPLIAGIALWYMAQMVVATVSSPWLSVVLASLAGGMVYFVSLYFLWRLNSRPDSGEALVVRKFIKLIRRKMP